MVTRAVLRYVRISPRKFRLIIPLIKGRRAEEAKAVLASVKKGASKYAIDLLNSALANTRRIQGIDPANLYISNLVASPGPMMKRFRAASMGRASMIKKRTSHITLELDEIKPAAHEHAGEKPKAQVSVKKTAKLKKGTPQKAAAHKKGKG